jgi:hypothetical protein
MPRCLVTPLLIRNIPGPYSDILLQGGFEVVYPPDGFDTIQKANLVKMLDGVDAILASVERGPVVEAWVDAMMTQPYEYVATDDLPRNIREGAWPAEFFDGSSGSRS